MPTVPYATCFMMAMCYEQHPGAAPWDDPAVLLALNITHPKIGVRQQGLPADKSLAIHAFISASRNRTLAARVAYIKEGDCDDGRIAYQAWFKKISTSVNTIIEHELMEADFHPAQIITQIGKNQFPCLDYWQSWSNALGEVIFGASRQWKSAQVKVRKPRQAALECMKALNNGPNFSLANLQAAMKAVKAWQAASLWLPEEGKLIQEHIATIEALFKTLGHVSERDEEQLPDELTGIVATARVVASQKRIIAADLANGAQVAQTWAEFTEYFVRTRTDRATRPTIEVDLADLDLELGAMGVGNMSNHTESQLEQLLGFPDRRPPQWATLRSDNPEITSWDPENASAYTKDSPGMAPLRLLWHQMVGIAAMLDQLFTEEPSPSVPGILLADAVGIGKTAQVMGVIAALQMILIAHEKGEGTIPLLASKSHFMGIGVVPDLPHLIIVPNTLVDQWCKELRTFFKPHYIDIFRMPTAAKDYMRFFKAGGEWSRAQHRCILRVVLIAQSTFQGSTKASHDLKDARADYPDRIRRSLPGHKDTVFGQQWCTVWIDEAHDFRGGNQGFVGAVHLRQRALPSLLFQVAHSLTQDVINMGRMIGVPELCGINGMSLQTERLREIARAKSNLSAKDRAQVSALKERQMRGEDISQERDPSREAAAVTYKVIKDLQRIFDGHLIRRTTNSLRYDGIKINDALNPYIEHNIAIYLPADEMNKLKECVDDMWAQRKTSNLADFSSHGFYNQYRVHLAYPYDTYPTFTSIEEWKKLPGTKLQTLLSILQHLLIDDSVEHASVDEHGELVLPQTSIPDGCQPTRARKILVYHEFPMMEKTIRSALSVHGINTFCINGSYSANQRARQVSEFTSSTDPDWRVFLFSSVGATGLNLACADVVILFDTVWSELTSVQIVGRAHRLGQKKQVHVYRLAALGTTDVIMSSLARSKDEMLNALVTKNTNPDLEKLLNHEADGSDVDEEDDNEEGLSSFDLELPSGRRKATKARRGTRNNAKAPLLAKVGTSKMGAKSNRKETHKDSIDFVNDEASPLNHSNILTTVEQVDPPTPQSDKNHPAEPKVQCSTNTEPRTIQTELPHPDKPTSLPQVPLSQHASTAILGPAPASTAASSPPLSPTLIISETQLQAYDLPLPTPLLPPPSLPTYSSPSPNSIPAPGSISALPSTQSSPTLPRSDLAPPVAARDKPQVSEDSMSSSPQAANSPTACPSPPSLPPSPPSIADFLPSPLLGSTQLPSSSSLPPLSLNSNRANESIPTCNQTPRLKSTPWATHNTTSHLKRPAVDSPPSPRPSQSSRTIFDRAASLHNSLIHDDDSDGDDKEEFVLVRRPHLATIRTLGRSRLPRAADGPHR
ncbi:hypothetical protein BD779DRAFT_1679866 [Infundibulicybe gibba]|nr:hypothetical protein BD779DRAFT_1679866 [Infundibulicybe gibba]